MKINPSLTEKENLIALLNDGKSYTASGEPYVLSLEDIDFGSPVALPPTEESSFSIDNPNNKPLKQNTKLTITAKGTSTKLKGETTFTYHRNSLEKQFLLLYGKKEVSVLSSEINSITDYSPTKFGKWFLNKYLKSSLAVNSVITVSAPSDKPNSDFSITITPSLTSYCVVDPITVLVKVIHEKEPITSLIPPSSPENSFDSFEYEVLKEVEEAVGPGFIYSASPNP